MHFSGKKVVLETRRFSRRISCPVWLFQAPEPSFPPIRVDGSRAQPVILGRTENSLENEAGTFHFSHSSSPLIHNLMDSLENSIVVAAVAEHFDVKKQTPIPVSTVQSG